MNILGLICDFDGVIADSEVLANSVLAQAISDLGYPTTVEEALSRYMGKRWAETTVLIEKETGRPLPKDFASTVKDATSRRFREELCEVEGARAFIRHFQELPCCIASSSSRERLRICLEILGLTEIFGDRVFSAEMVEYGKPRPDIFLIAAREMRVSPKNCLVIEDSVSGVEAGLAAGMAVLGLCAGSHVRLGHAEKLKEAGAHRIAATWGEALSLVSSLREGHLRL